MSPGRLEIGKEEGLREKQIKGTQLDFVIFLQDR